MIRLWCILYYNRREQNNLYYKKEETNMMQSLQSPVEFYKNLPKKVCPECGQVMTEQAESYLMECDRCLSKKEE